MTARQQAFVAHYLTTLNASEAARQAGYSAKTADRIGHENLKKPEIAAAVRAGKRAQLAAADLSAARTLEELRRIAFADPRQDDSQDKARGGEQKPGYQTWAGDWPPPQRG